MNTAQKIAQGLLQTEAVKISINPPFTWVSGIKSPIYCDNRKLISFPDVRETIVSEFIIAAGKYHPEVIAGTATAGIPWAAFVAYQMKLPMVYVRPEPKGHGTGKQVEGHLDTGKRVLLIEDLVSTGGSSINSAEALRREGQSDVVGVLAIVTYEMAKATGAFAAAELPLTTLTTFTDILTEVQAQGYLSPEQVKLVAEFGKDPASWWESFQSG
ncbi:MAG: orotate phosphoribosyltransferase [bacterium]|nr:orotate phosphoribosyltransferase [bacterium]